VCRRPSSPLLDGSGRQIIGSIYHDQFSAKSPGNYYHSNEAFFTYSTAPAAVPGISVTFPPKYDSMQSIRKRNQIITNTSPMNQLRVSREEMKKLAEEEEKRKMRPPNSNNNRGGGGGSSSGALPSSKK
jgi:hypothetical protein